MNAECRRCGVTAMSVQVANELRKILFELESTRLQEDTVSARRRLLALAERLEDAGFPMAGTQPAGTPAADDRDRCRSVMYWQAGARRSDSRHECELPDGHDGFHRAASGYTWGARPAERDGERRAAAETADMTAGGEESGA